MTTAITTRAGKGSELTWNEVDSNFTNLQATADAALPANATALNKVTLTGPATGSTLTIADGKTLTASNTLTLAGTDSTTMTFPSVSASIPGLAVANTFTATQTVTPAANTSALTSTGYSLTGSNASALFDLAGTWNTSGTPTAIKLNVTDTASNASSMLMDLQVGGVSKLNLGKDGVLYVDVLKTIGVQSLVRKGRWNNDVLLGANDVLISSTAAAVLKPTINLAWANNSFGTTVDPVIDATLARSAAGSINFSDNANGKALGIKMLTELTTIAASAYTDTTIQMPAGAIVLGVSVRVTTAITCTSTFTVGDSGNASRFSTAAVSKAANSTDPGTAAGAYYNASALSVRITPDTTPTDNTGRVRVTVHYVQITPPSS